MEILGLLNEEVNQRTTKIGWRQVERESGFDRAALSACRTSSSAKREPRTAGTERQSTSMTQLTAEQSCIQGRS
ncbi:hypothetical protein J6590_047491 [Homalodisca vitripennis]|nr:hypothetical protein J6590_047491 [Homalodisca vitripennis]